jgi:hypothetical protein
MRRLETKKFTGTEMISKLLPGPGTHEEWVASWRVFRSAMIMLSAASPGALDDYAEGIRHLTLFHPHAWSDIAVAEEKMRWEHWDRMREELVELISLGHPPIGFNPKMPWDYIIGASTYGPPSNPTAYWWTLQLTGGLASSSSTQSVVAALEGRTSAHHTVIASLTRRPGGRQQPGRSDKAPPAKVGACRKFNEGNCRVKDCKWQHVCDFCKKPGHISTTCFAKPGNPRRQVPRFLGRRRKHAESASDGERRLRGIWGPPKRTAPLVPLL